MALAAWLPASAAAFLMVSYTSFLDAAVSFFGVAVIGLTVYYAIVQIRLDEVPSALATSGLGAQLQAEQALPVEQRRSGSRQQSLSTEAMRFFKLVGLGLMVVGLCGGLYRLL
ncbi:MAG: hypothetical protein GEV13_26250 [Rhodospirillales bacterium]|nr:hypothetical protein [Rhodospirillales bacterium]